MTKSRNLINKKHVWTDDEIATLRDLYPHLKTSEVAALLGLSITQIYSKAKQIGIGKTDEFRASALSGRIASGGFQHPSMIATRFKPGQISWNKGRKMPDHPASVATRFKPGQKPKQTLPLGTYRINPDGQLEQKVTELPGAPHLRWHAVSRIVWERHNGPVPKGNIVVFKPGMRTAELELITLDRLECIPRGLNAVRNHPRTKHPELGPLIQLKGAITRQVNRIAREAQEKTK